MSYAAKLIEQAQNAHGYTLTELALALGVKHPTVSQWKSGRGSPMSEDRVIELCKLAGIKDPDPWLIGVHAEGLKNAEARKRLTSLARQLGAAAAVAAVALLALPLTGYEHANAAFLALFAIPEQDALIYIMRSDAAIALATATLACVLHWALSRLKDRAYGPSPVLA